MAEEKNKNEEVRMISAEEFAKSWDQERRVSDLDPLLFKLRDRTLYFPARIKADMDDVHGGPTPAVRTLCFEDYRVWIAPCKSDHPDARALRPTTDTQSAAELAFAVHIKKLEVTVPRTRTFIFPAKKLPVQGGGWVYEISFAEFKNTKRQLGDAAASTQSKRGKRAPKAIKPVEPAEPAATESMDEEEEE